MAVLTSKDDVVQSDPELLSRTEGEVQQLAQEVEQLRLAMQSQVCNGQ